MAALCTVGALLAWNLSLLSAGGRESGSVPSAPAVRHVKVVAALGTLHGSLSTVTTVTSTGAVLSDSRGVSAAQARALARAQAQAEGRARARARKQARKVADEVAGVQSEGADEEADDDEAKAEQEEDEGQVAEADEDANVDEDEVAQEAEAAGMAELEVDAGLLAPALSTPKAAADASLPSEIAPASEEEWGSEEDGRTFFDNAQTVCAVATNPRQGSIFRSDLLSQLGSGKYTYLVRPHGRCPWGVPRVRMVPYVKCCSSMPEVRRTLVSSAAMYDVVIVTGDEYCQVKSSGLFQFRQYHGTSVIGQAPDGGPRFFPLGPRHEFERVDQLQLVAAAQREYRVNFVGSPTSVPRRMLRDFFASPAWQRSAASRHAFIHVTDGWTTTVDPSKGYISPERYREVLLQSSFTLCPIGHNPEAYRIYEACEAGSVPVIVTGEQAYLEHKCEDAFRPFLDAGAPFVVLQSWDELSDFLAGPATNASFVADKQRALRLWYTSYMTAFARDFEMTLERAFQLRMQRRPAAAQQETQARRRRPLLAQSETPRRAAPASRLAPASRALPAKRQGVRAARSGGLP